MGQSLKKVYPWLAQAGETWKASAMGLKGKGCKGIVLSLTVVPLVIHSFTLHSRFLCSDWEKLLEGGCTSLTDPYPAEQGTDVTDNTGWGSGIQREEHY